MKKLKNLLKVKGLNLHELMKVKAGMKAPVDDCGGSLCSGIACSSSAGTSCDSISCVKGICGTSQCDNGA